METSYKFNSRLSRQIEIIDVILALILVGFAIYSLLNYSAIKSQVFVGINNFGIMGLFLIIVFLEIIPQVINPVFVTWAGILSGYNISAIIVISIIASLAGSILGFWIGEKYGMKYIYALFNEKTFYKVSKFWQKYDKLFVAVSAVTPVPFVPLIFGALGMRWKDFIIFGLIFRIFNYLIFGYLFYFGFWSI